METNLTLCRFYAEQTLDRQITQRDNVASGTTLAIQRLDQKNVDAIGDLRVRVARYSMVCSQVMGQTLKTRVMCSCSLNSCSSYKKTQSMFLVCCF